MVDEHRDRPPHMPADEKHVRQRVAAGIFKVVDHDIGIIGFDGGDQTGRGGDADELLIARFAQAFLDDRGPNLVRVDDEDP